MLSKLWQAMLTVSLITFLSRILGYCRDMLAAVTFGATGAYDAFLLAFKIPNFLRRLVAEGAFSQAFVPVLAKINQNTPEEESLFLSHVAGCLLQVLLGLTLLGVLGAEPIVRVFAPGFVGDPRFDMTVDLLRVTFPYLLFIALTAFYSGILNTHQKFAAAAATPIILNLCMIGSMLFLTQWLALPVQSLAIGVLIGGMLQALFLVPALKKIGLLPGFRANWRDSSVKRVMVLMGPAIFGASVIQINLLVDAVFASFLPAGTLTWLYYADRMIELPMGVLGVTISTVSLPYLAKRFSAGDKLGYQSGLDWGLRTLILVGVPASVGLFYLSGPILITLFQYGAFAPDDVFKTQLALEMLSAALLAYFMIKLFVNAFYAMEDTKLPVKVACVSLLVNCVGNALLIGPLQHQGLALASALSALTNATLLLGVLCYRKQYRLPPHFGQYLLKVVCAVAVMFGLLVFATPAVEHWFDWSAMKRLASLMSLIAMGGASYFLVLFVLRLEGLRLPRHILYTRQSGE